MRQASDACASLPSSTLPDPAPSSPAQCSIPPRTIITESDPASEIQTLQPEPSIPSPPADHQREHSTTLHYLLTCIRIFAACTLVTTPLSFFGWLVIAHIYVLVRPQTPVDIELFCQASAAGGALVGACFALSICLFFSMRHCKRRARREDPELPPADVFPPLHALSAAETVLCVSLVLVGVAFSAAVGMALMSDTTTDELGLREAATVGGLCAIPGGIGVVSCGCRRAWRVLRRDRQPERAQVEKVEGSSSAA